MSSGAPGQICCGGQIESRVPPRQPRTPACCSRPQKGLELLDVRLAAGDYLEGAVSQAVVAGRPSRWPVVRRRWLPRPARAAPPAAAAPAPRGRSPAWMALALVITEGYPGGASLLKASGERLPAARMFAGEEGLPVAVAGLPWAPGLLWGLRELGSALRPPGPRLARDAGALTALPLRPSPPRAGGAPVGWGVHGGPPRWWRRWKSVTEATGPAASRPTGDLALGRLSGPGKPRLAELIRGRHEKTRSTGGEGEGLTIHPVGRTAVLCNGPPAATRRRWPRHSRTSEDSPANLFRQLGG